MLAAAQMKNRSHMEGGGKVPYDSHIPLTDHKGMAVRPPPLQRVKGLRSPYFEFRVRIE